MSKVLLGIDPGTTFAGSACVLWMPATREARRLSAPEALDAEVTAATVELPRTFGKVSGYPNIWAMHDAAVTWRERLFARGFTVYTTDSGRIRNQVAGWPEGHSGFDAWWKRRITKLYGAALVEALLDEHGLDGLCAAQFGESNPVLIDRWRYRG